MQTDKNREDRKKVAHVLVIVVIISALLLGWFTYRQVERHPMSEDGVIQADVVHVSTPVAGRVMHFNVQEGSRVKKGDLLFSLDPSVYELRVKQAEAELHAAEAALDARRRAIQAETANAAIADEQVERARHNLMLAERTYQRLVPLAAKGYVTKQQLDDAATLRNDAQVSLKQAQSQADAARQLVGTLDAAQAMVEVSRSALDIARKALADTQVHAPHDGLVVGLTTSTGQYVAPDQSLFTLINTNSWHATAFFRETDLANIELGACAAVYLLGYPGVKLSGQVENIGWGISSADMIELPRNLPFVQKSLNWVRVAQRFPVRIRLDPTDERYLRMGASVDVVIRHGGGC